MSRYDAMTSTIEIEREFLGADGEWDTVMIEVTYMISGSYWRGDYYNPPEFPDVEFIAACTKEGPIDITDAEWAGVAYHAINNDPRAED